MSMVWRLELSSEARPWDELAGGRPVGQEPTRQERSDSRTRRQAANTLSKGSGRGLQPISRNREMIHHVILKPAVTLRPRCLPVVSRVRLNKFI